MFGAGNGAGSGPVENHANLRDVFAGDFQGIQQRGRGDNGRAVLIVMENGDFHGAPQLFFDQETLRRLDVFEIDAAEGRLKHLTGTDYLAGIMGGEFDIENVNIRKALEQNAFSFHHGFSGERPYVAQTEHGGAVSDHRDEVSLGGVFIGKTGVAFDGEAGNGNPGGISQA